MGYDGITEVIGKKYSSIGARVKRHGIRHVFKNAKGREKVEVSVNLVCQLDMCCLFIDRIHSYLESQRSPTPWHSKRHHEGLIYLTKSAFDF